MRKGISETQAAKLVGDASIGIVRYGEAFELAIPFSALPDEVVKWLTVSRVFAEIITLDRPVLTMMANAATKSCRDVYQAVDGQEIRFGIPTSDDANVAFEKLQRASVASLMALSRWYETDEVAEIRFAHEDSFLSLTFDKRGLIRNKTNVDRTSDNTLIRRAMMSVKLPMLRRTYRSITQGGFDRFESLEGLLFEINALLASCAIVASISRV